MEAKLIEEDLNPPVRHLSQLKIVRFYTRTTRSKDYGKKKKKDYRAMSL